MDALAAAMQTFLALPLAAVEEMGDAAHTQALERHSIDIEAGKLAQLFAAAASPTPAHVLEEKSSYDAAA